jgi:RNA polymerase sigma-70 factor (ECF subfamily)
LAWSSVRSTATRGSGSLKAELQRDGRIAEFGGFVHISRNSATRCGVNAHSTVQNDARTSRDRTLPAPAHEADRLRALKAGDRAAFDWLFQTYSERVWRYVARLLGGRTEDVADVVQETFMHVGRSIRQFDPQRGSLWGWMCGVAQNRVRVHWRSRQRQDRKILPGAPPSGTSSTGEWIDAEPSPIEALLASETAAVVRDALSDLPDEYTMCLLAKYVDGQSAAQLAADLGESIEAVRSRLARARQSFREAYARRIPAQARDDGAPVAR